jgi:hypothetical protein
MTGEDEEVDQSFLFSLVGDEPHLYRGLNSRLRITSLNQTKHFVVLILFFEYDVNCEFNKFEMLNCELNAFSKSVSALGWGLQVKT